MAIKDNIVTPRGEGERLRRGRHGAARQVDRPDRAHLRRSRTRSRRRPTSSTPRSCRRRPSARRTDADAMPGAIVVSAFVALDGRQPRLRRRHAARPRSKACRSAIEEGEFAAVVGPSGCGKSTLMKLATGLQFPFKGTVAVAGERSTSRSRSPAWRSRRRPCCRGGPRSKTCCCRSKSSSRTAARCAASAPNTSRAPKNLLTSVGLARPGRQIPLGAVGRHAAAHLALPRADPRAASC